MKHTKHVDVFSIKHSIRSKHCILYCLVSSIYRNVVDRLLKASQGPLMEIARGMMDGDAVGLIRRRDYVTERFLLTSGDGRTPT